MATEVLVHVRVAWWVRPAVRVVSWLFLLTPEQRAWLVMRLVPRGVTVGVRCA